MNGLLENLREIRGGSRHTVRQNLKSQLLRLSHHLSNGSMSNIKLVVLIHRGEVGGTHQKDQTFIKRVGIGGMAAWKHAGCSHQQPMSHFFASLTFEAGNAEALCSLVGLGLYDLSNCRNIHSLCHGNKNAKETDS